jgi:pimeloyl-ACP methyl ester carboxylesterase
MNRLALSHSHERVQLAERLPDAEVPAVGRLSELLIPVLVIVGAHDIPYMQAAADYMAEKIPSVRVEIMADAAHLPNMDHPDQFRRMVSEFP